VLDFHGFDRLWIAPVLVRVGADVNTGDADW